MKLLDQKLLQAPQNMRRICFGVEPSPLDARPYQDEVEQLLPKCLEAVAAS